jgi:hypothetical protein
LFDYFGVEDLTCETMEMLEVSKVMKWVRGLVSSGTVVAIKGTARAFSVNFWPNLVGYLDSFSFLH